MLDLPPELIEEIDQYLSFADKKKFREVCLACPFLKHAYNVKIEESGILKVDFQDHDLCVKFAFMWTFYVVKIL